MFKGKQEGRGGVRDKDCLVLHSNRGLILPFLLPFLPPSLPFSTEVPESNLAEERRNLVPYFL